jgi:hypothetical protein
MRDLMERADTVMGATTMLMAGPFREMRLVNAYCSGEYAPLETGIRVNFCYSPSRMTAIACLVLFTNGDEAQLGNFCTIQIFSCGFWRENIMLLEKVKAHRSYCATLAIAFCPVLR